MKEQVTIAALAAYAIMVFVGSFVWEQLRESWSQPKLSSIDSADGSIRSNIEHRIPRRWRRALDSYFNSAQ